MSKHIGIVACSAEGAALCYQTICLEAAQFMGEHYHPEITMHTHSLGQYMVYIEQGDWDEVAALMLSSTEKLQKSGAEFIICPDNTIHQAFDLVHKKSLLPWLHIAEVVATVAKNKGFTKLGILGTKFLMEGPVYPEVLNKIPIHYEIPDSNERIAINDIIFKELVKGILHEKTRLFFNQIMSNLRAHGCQAVVLGCTEIPLIIDQADTPLPTLDSTRLLARSALTYSLKQ
jgi:aspartate racemase